MPSHASQGTTYIPDVREEAQIIDFAQALEEHGITPPESRPALIDADGRRTEIPEKIFEVLRQVATALAQRRGVTVAFPETLLTTQQAADFLGMSRPTLIKLLEQGAIAYTLTGRHRRIRLADVVAYQTRLRSRRKAQFAEQAADAQHTEAYKATADDHTVDRRR